MTPRVADQVEVDLRALSRAKPSLPWTRSARGKKAGKAAPQRGGGGGK